MTKFCHIVPTTHLHLTNGRPVHLVLAHLIEQDDNYVRFYRQQKQKYNCTIIMDNSGFEMFKQNKSMYPPDKLVQMGNKINADYIVMTDYPSYPSERTIAMAKDLAPILHRHGFKTFFVPQGVVGSEADALQGFYWAADRPDLVDYIGVSILTAPNAYGVESGNKLQRFVSRLKLMYKLKDSKIFAKLYYNGTKIHFLGMVDGPNEIMYMSPFRGFIDTWDSSAAVWAGLNGIHFDGSPTGLIDGKFEQEVDFNFTLLLHDYKNIIIAQSNIDYIDQLVSKYLEE